MSTKNIFPKLLVMVLAIALVAVWSIQVAAQTSQYPQTGTNSNPSTNPSYPNRSQSGTTMNNMTMSRYLVMINAPSGDCETFMRNWVTNLPQGSMGMNRMDHGTNSNDMDHGSTDMDQGSKDIDHGTSDVDHGGTYGDTSMTGRSRTYSGRSMFMREWGCSSDQHTGYLITTANSETEALSVVPDSLRTNARAIKLSEISMHSSGTSKDYDRSGQTKSRKSTTGSKKY